MTYLFFIEPTNDSRSVVCPQLANNAKYDTISFVKYGDKPLVVVTSRIARAVCRPPYFVVF